MVLPTTRKYISIEKMINLMPNPSYFTIVTSNFWTVYTSDFVRQFFYSGIREVNIHKRSKYKPLETTGNYHKS